MKLTDLSENSLKELIFEHLFIELDKNKASDSYFSFTWDNNQSVITYKDIDLIVHGNSCWEDSQEEKTYTQANKLNTNFFGEFFESFLIEDYILERKFSKNITDEYLYYLDNHKSEYDYHCFIHENHTEEDYDAYGNYNRVRQLDINVDEILIYLRNMPFVKSIDKASSIFSNLSNDKMSKIQLFSEFTEKFPEKKGTSKKMKI